MRRILTVAFLRSWKRERWRHLQAMEAEQWLDREAMRRAHDEKLAAILRQAVAEVPGYRDLAARRGWRAEEIGPDHLAGFPLVDKAVLTADQASHMADNARQRDMLAAKTGGSTGTWFRFYSDWRSREYRQAGDLLGRTWTGWRVGEPQALIWGHPGDLKAGRRPQARLNNVLLHRSIILNAWQLNEEALDAFIGRLRRHQPRMLLGYASALAYLARAMRERGVADVRPRGVISAAEYLGDEQRTVIEEQFCCQVLNRYGSREFGTVAQQCERAGGFHIFTDRVHVEVLHPDGSPCSPGERGEIIVTDLTNRVMPFIRYRTGDLAVASGETCPCGRGHPLLASVEGRVSELIVGLNGEIYACPGPALWLKGMSGVRQLQVYQPDRRNIEARVVPDEEWCDEAAGRLEDRFRKLLGPVDVRIVLKDEIPVSASGKFRSAISDVSPFSRLADTERN